MTHRPAYARLELPVVIAVVALLAALLVYVVYRVGEAAGQWR